MDQVGLWGLVQQARGDRNLVLRAGGSVKVEGKLSAAAATEELRRNTATSGRGQQLLPWNAAGKRIVVQRKLEQGLWRIQAEFLWAKAIRSGDSRKVLNFPF